MFSHNSHNKGNGRDSKTLITGEVSAQAPSACGRQLEAVALGAPPHGLPSRCPVLVSLRKGVSLRTQRVLCLFVSESSPAQSLTSWEL